MVQKWRARNEQCFLFRNWIVQTMLRQVIHIPQESPENIKLSSSAKKTETDL